MEKKGSLLIVDDSEDILFALNAMLTPYLEKIRVTTSPEKITRFMDDFQPDVILLDMNFENGQVGGEEGFRWLGKILNADPKAVVVMMTAYADTDKAVQAIKKGATDFVSKPWNREKMIATVNSALNLSFSRREAQTLKTGMSGIARGNLGEIIGRSEAMDNVFRMIDRISGTDANVLLLGENGTGKDLIANTIHYASSRSGEVLVEIDLGSIAESLFESELFGYEKGAFTDAKGRKQGRIEIASGGTVFLNEIGNLSLSMQSRMLTAIDKKYVTRLGSTTPTPIDVRFISATNADLHEQVEKGEFRQDLLYRINTIEIYIPPLRERGEDILLLADYFMGRMAHKYKKGVENISEEAKRKLRAYKWPGNVRELQNVIEKAIILSNGRSLKAEDVILTSREAKQSSKELPLNLEMLEREAILKAVRLSEGNLNKAAELLGVSRYALYRKMGKYEKE